MSYRDRVLIVDDNPVNVAILEEILSEHYRVAIASSGEEALTKALDFRPALMLLDIMMPGIDGYETCRRVRQHPVLRQAKIIMVSGKAMLEERLRGYDAGADDYITKPFEQEELLAKVQVYLRLKTIEEVDQLKSDVLTLLSHETRTPLNAIMAPVQMLMMDDDMPAEMRAEFLHMIQDGATRLLHLFEQVVRLSQLKTGDGEFHFIEMDVCSVARRAVDMIACQAAERHVQIQQELPEPAVTVIDPQHMLGVMTSMLDNAIRFSPVGGQVTIGVHDVAEAIQITVTDHGEGIAPEFLPHVFEEFTQADLAHHSRGHGLSMAIARHVVQAHGGTITVESSQQIGTTFRVGLQQLLAGRSMLASSRLEVDALPIPREPGLIG